MEALVVPAVAVETGLVEAMPEVLPHQVKATQVVMDQLLSPPIQEVAVAVEQAEQVPLALLQPLATVALVYKYQQRSEILHQV